MAYAAIVFGTNMKNLKQIWNEKSKYVTLIDKGVKICYRASTNNF